MRSQRLPPRPLAPLVPPRVCWLTRNEPWDMRARTDGCRVFSTPSTSSGCTTTGARSTGSAALPSTGRPLSSATRSSRAAWRMGGGDRCGQGGGSRATDHVQLLGRGAIVLCTGRCRRSLGAAGACRVSVESGTCIELATCTHSSEGFRCSGYASDLSSPAGSSICLPDRHV